MTSRALYEGFVASAADHPRRPALQVDGVEITYAALFERVRAIAATLGQHRFDGAPRRTCVLAQRSVTAFAGILGASCAGDGYVPLLPSHPAARLRSMIARSGARTMVVDRSGMAALPGVLAELTTPMVVVAPDGPTDAALAARHPQHVFVGADGLRPAVTWRPPVVGADDVAYLLFTSGSTGVPKGVMVAHRNIAHFIDVVVERYGLAPDDRFSHMFEPTFDLSLFDMFAAWQVGGCVCCPDARARLMPARYVADAGLTVWFSVPSAVRLMMQAGALVPGAFERLRWSLFCGEALPTAVAQAWATAAPGSIVENLYGPTELTLACTVHRCGVGHGDGDDDGHGVVPIGAPLPGMHARVVDAALHDVAPGHTGELIVAGPQVALGYLDDAERTAAVFVRPPDGDELYYRTGDKVVRPARDRRPLHFLGRIDDQMKIRGYRVELGEIEATLRDVGGLPTAIATGWPLAQTGGADGVVAFIDVADGDVHALLRTLAERLPAYMVPKEIVILDRFPLNDNGKVDRAALVTWLRTRG